MEEFLPSEIARLVLGYLEEEKCLETYEKFIKTSSNLKEVLKFWENGKKFDTRFNGSTLCEILNEYLTIKYWVEETENKIKLDMKLKPITLIERIKFLFTLIRNHYFNNEFNLAYSGEKKLPNKKKSKNIKPKNNLPNTEEIINLDSCESSIEEITESENSENEMDILEVQNSTNEKSPTKNNEKFKTNKNSVENMETKREIKVEFDLESIKTEDISIDETYSLCIKSNQSSVNEIDDDKDDNQQLKISETSYENCSENNVHGNHKSQEENCQIISENAQQFHESNDLIMQTSNEILMPSLSNNCSIQSSSQIFILPPATNLTDKQNPPKIPTNTYFMTPNQNMFLQSIPTSQMLAKQQMGLSNIFLPIINQSSLIYQDSFVPNQIVQTKQTNQPNEDHHQTLDSKSTTEKKLKIIENKSNLLTIEKLRKRGRPSKKKLILTRFKRIVPKIVADKTKDSSIDLNNENKSKQSSDFSTRPSIKDDDLLPS